MDIQLIKDCEAKAQAWLDSPYYDEETKAEIAAMLQDEDKTALVDAFYQSLEFGTGGLRGIMGAGTNRMNKYIVGMATQGFANYINRQRTTVERCCGPRLPQQWPPLCRDGCQYLQCQRHKGLSLREPSSNS